MNRLGTGAISESLKSMAEVLTPIETIAHVKAELLDLAANEIGRSAEDTRQRCGELAEVLGNALSQLHEDQK